MTERTLDPVTLQVMAGALRAICEEMGATLVHSAYSANIKERRDASTALFDPNGEMIMQAEHIPVHLGAMPAAVAAVVDREHQPGDTWILNDPYRGGTHLPDITLVTPLFVDGELTGFAANRAHHADVGGSTPGSMPAGSRTLDEEGVVIPPSRLIAAGQLDVTLLSDLISKMREPRQREADLRAQLAANAIAGERVEQLIARYGRSLLSDGMSAVLDYAERRTMAAIREIPDGVYVARDFLENDFETEIDVPIAVRVEIAGDRAEIDFRGTADQIDGNLNCPLSVTKSAVYFVLRVLTDPDIPACAGAYRPISVSAPNGCLVNARPPAAVVGGNVETSSRIADVVMLAFGEAMDVPALGQGTMNNLTLGNDDFVYYETIAGGQGACPDAPGPSAVHVAMSNTLNTPIEALELEFPLRVREYSVLRGSGGQGEWRGGDGVAREFTALEPMEFSILSERRRHAPAGSRGGCPGREGGNFFKRSSGGSLRLAAKAQGTLETGDGLRVETPGGGGHGEPPAR